MPQTKLIAGVPVLNYHTAGELGSANEQKWVVMAKPGTSDAEILKLCAMNRDGCKLKGHANIGVPFFDFRGTESELEAVLRSSPGAVKYVEPDGVASIIPDIKVDGVEAATWGLTRVGADQRSKSGAGVTVFVLDCGVRVTHQEFGGRAIPALDTSGGSLVECDGNQNCAMDRLGHGTHCAGSAAGASYGVAPGSRVQALKVIGDQGTGEWSGIYAAVDWVAVNPERPAVASLSLGAKGNLQAMADAVNGATNAGVIMVVASGNENIDACGITPAYIPSAIAVGATNSLDERSDFSNWGTCVDIFAPGSEIISSTHSADWSSYFMSGTSMACPHVSGAAALILEVDPTKKASAVRQALQETAEWGVLTGLMPGDTNALLNVAEGGGGGPSPTPGSVPTPTTSGPSPTPGPVPTPTPSDAPTPAPTTCPSEFSSGPDPDGDCLCNPGSTCYEDGTRGCTWSMTEQYGSTSTYFFVVGCSGCVCQV